jgi:hypothetical protein
MAPGMPLKGKDAIRKGVATFLNDKNFTLKWTTTKVEAARGSDLAYAYGAYTATQTNPNSHKPATEVGKYVCVYGNRAMGPGRRFWTSTTPTHLPSEQAIVGSVGRIRGESQWGPGSDAPLHAPRARESALRRWPRNTDRWKTVASSRAQVSGKTVPSTGKALEGRSDPSVRLDLKSARAKLPFGLP